MPVCAFAFGSFGDIVTIIQFVQDLRSQLIGAGNSQQIRALLVDIDIFTHAVEEVQGFITRRGSVLQPDVVNGIGYALAACKDVLEAVHRKTPAQRRQAQGVSFWEGLRAATAWTLLGGCTEIEALRKRLRDHVGLMQTYLALSQCHDQAAIRETVDEQHTTLDRLFDVVQAIHEHFGVDTPSFQFRNERTGEFYEPCARTSAEQLDALCSAVDIRFKMNCIPFRFSHQMTVGRQNNFQETIQICDPFALPVDCYYFLSDFGQWHVLIALSPNTDTPTVEREDLQRRIHSLLKKRRNFTERTVCHCNTMCGGDRRGFTVEGFKLIRLWETAALLMQQCFGDKLTDDGVSHILHGLCDAWAVEHQLIPRLQEYASDAACDPDCNARQAAEDICSACVRDYPSYAPFLVEYKAGEISINNRHAVPDILVTLMENA